MGSIWFYEKELFSSIDQFRKFPEIWSFVK